MKRTAHNPPFTERAFTLVELLVSMVVLIVLLLLILSVTNRMLVMWKTGNDRSRSFLAVISAMETVKRQTAQARLNTYWAYRNNAGQPPSDQANFVPESYGRASELFFLAAPAAELLGAGYGPGSALFFQAAGGYSEIEAFAQTSGTLNTRGYFVRFDSDESTMPPFVQAIANYERRYRYRLYEVDEPTENLMVYADTTDPNFFDWAAHAAGTSPDTPGGHARPIAENVVLFLVRSQYRDRNGAEVFSYTYNSRSGGNPQPPTQHQLPPKLEITLVALDENSARRLAAEFGSTPPPLIAAGLFTNAGAYESDLHALEKSLADRHLTYRIYREDVALLAANWSETP